MNWYKQSQFAPQNSSNVGTPLVMVYPYEPIVNEVVEELRSENPSFFTNVNKINLDTSYGQFGSVKSTDPADININLDKIKSQIGSEVGSSFDAQNPQHLQILKSKIREVIVHEGGHVSDAEQAQSKSEIPLAGEKLFPGGEQVAEQAVRKMFSSNKKKVLNKTASFDYKNQESENAYLPDVQRYVLDSYSINISLNKTAFKITVSIVMQNAYIGGLIFNKFWIFTTEEEKKARTLYKKVLEISKEILSDIVKNEKPTVLICPMLRNALVKINYKDACNTNIPHLNYAEDLIPESDWRSTIYGNRYPVHKEESFHQTKIK